MKKARKSTSARKTSPKPVIAVVGSGVVGQATGRGFLARGFEVLFVDVNEKVVKRLRREGLRAYTPQQLANSSEDDSSVTLLTVSTPTANGEISLKYIEQAAADVGRRMNKKRGYRVVVVRSTVPPGTTQERIIPLLEKYSGRTAGQGFGVCMNPEYLREASAEQDFKHPWLIVIGQLDKRSGDALIRLYRGYRCPIRRLSLGEAEMQKYVHNLFNAAKISYFNEMREVAHALNLNAEEIFKHTAVSCEGMWNPRYGTKDLGPFSGMCLPKDTQAFYAWARRRGFRLPHLAATIAVNEALSRRLQREARHASRAASLWRLLPAPLANFLW